MMMVFAAAVTMQSHLPAVVGSLPTSVQAPISGGPATGIMEVSIQVPRFLGNWALGSASELVDLDYDEPENPVSGLLAFCIHMTFMSLRLLLLWERITL